MNWLSGMLEGGTGDQWESSMIMLWDYMGVNGDK
jgi:hypothetical protein